MDQYGKHILTFGDIWRVPIPWKAISKLPMAEVFEVMKIICRDGVTFQAFNKITKTDSIFTISDILLAQMSFSQFTEFCSRNKITSIKYFVFETRSDAEKFVLELKQKELVLALMGKL